MMQKFNVFIERCAIILPMKIIHQIQHYKKM